MEESTNEIPMYMNNVEDTYENSLEMNYVEGRLSYDTRMDRNNVEAEVHADTKKTAMKKRTVIIIFLILIFIFVGVCVGVYFTAKAIAEYRDNVTVLPTVTVTDTVSKVTPCNTQVNNVTCPPPECTRCLDGWVTYETSCYLFGSNENMTFLEAVLFCNTSNAHLIEVGSFLENQFVEDFLFKLKVRSYWIGITDITTEDTFLLYSSSEPATFFNWGNGEPGQRNNTDSNEDCVVFDSFDNYTWHDYPCDWLKYSICER